MATAPEPTTTEHEIRAGDYRAVITARGGALRELTFRGRHLVVPFERGAPIPEYRGVIAAPWPNRVADGRFTFEDRVFELPVNEPERGCALHGLAHAADWHLGSAGERSVTLGLELRPTPGYPFPLRLEATYALEEGGTSGDGGLRWQVRASNTGRQAAPYGVCPHPYLVAGTSPLDAWSLELPARAFLEVTPDRLLPTRMASVQGHAFDFLRGRHIGETAVDHAFTDIAFDSAGLATALLRDPQGTGVGMEWDRACPWVQVHSADRVPPVPSRLGLALEPMTCPPDAFNSGTDLIVLGPGATHIARWRIFALGH